MTPTSFSDGAGALGPQVTPAPRSPRVYRILIADDEPLARDRLRTLLASREDFTCVGECSDGEQLLEAVRTHAPDLVLLDVEMPRLDGLSAWRRLGRTGSGLPLAIFVTAHAEFALDGFEVEAVDYLLKPVSRARFDHALDRARSMLGLSPGGALVVSREAGDASPAGRRYRDVLVLKHDGEYHFVRVDDIVWAGAEGDFVKVHTVAGAHLVRQSLGSIESVLDPQQFLRIHRSHFVARSRIRKVFVVQRSDYAVVMADGTELRVSRPYFEKIKQLLTAHDM